jgi:monovalent cation:H+ antiporter-2, CPA2 family
MDHARLIVIATPEGYQTRRVIELAPTLNPDIDTAVRTHSETEVVHLERQGVGIAIVGERELAFGLMEHALRSLGNPRERPSHGAKGASLRGRRATVMNSPCPTERRLAR